jgi:uncharacterized protein (DUF433 family)
MVMLNVSSGKGIYTLPEAARYARMSTTTLSRWFKGNTSGERVFDSVDEDAKIINFLDFVQALAVRNLKLHYGSYSVTLQKIRDAISQCSAEHGLTYPFARRHMTYLFEGQIWIKPEGKEGPIIQVSGKGHGQTGMTTVIERFLVDLSYDETGLANKYKAFRQGENSIFMDPKIRFGEPLLENCGYTPRALAEAAKTEGSVEEAAKIYGVTKEQVEISIDYFDYLQAA